MEKGGEGRRGRGMGESEKEREGREKFNSQLKCVPVNVAG